MRDDLDSVWRQNDERSSGNADVRVNDYSACKPFHNPAQLDPTDDGFNPTSYVYQSYFEQNKPNPIRSSPLVSLTPVHP